MISHDLENGYSKKSLLQALSPIRVSSPGRQALVFQWMGHDLNKNSYFFKYTFKLSIKQAGNDLQIERLIGLLQMNLQT